MTDREKFKKFFDEYDIHYEENIFDPDKYHSAYVLAVSRGSGHRWLVHDFRFDEDGNYKSHGIFE